MKPSILLVAAAGIVTCPAAIIYSGIRDISIPADFEGVYLDLDTATVTTASSPDWDINPFFGGYAVGNSPSFQPAREGSALDSPIITISLGSVIDGSLNYGSDYGGSETHVADAGGTFPSGVPALLGFVFNPVGLGSPVYGWMRVTFTMNEPGAMIHDWAWEDEGGSIQAGQTSPAVVPEPSSAILVITACGLLLRRRRA